MITKNALQRVKLRRMHISVSLTYNVSREILFRMWDVDPVRTETPTVVPGGESDSASSG
jgi:hypothetical protein